MRRASIIILAFIAVSVLAVPVAAQEAADDATRPNIILFLVDDLGWQDTSVAFWSQRTHFNDRYRTPNVAALAARGLKFTNAYASSPVCTPSRTSMLTGMSPIRSHITYWTFHKDRDTSNAHPTLEPPKWNVNGLDETDITLPRLLSGNGYRTIHVGKAHFGAHGTSGADPCNLGFDISIAGHASGGPASYYGRHHFTVAGREGNDPDAPDARKTVWDVPGLEKYHGEDIYLTEALTIEACGAIDEAVADEVPFFMNFAPYAVHAPIMANERYLENYEGLDPREQAYATMIETMDAALGSIVNVLIALDQLDNTIIIFTSDNGGLSAHARGGLPHTHNFPLSSGKGSAYEGGVRVPGIICWPGVIDAGLTNDTPIISHDLFPTILSMAGVPIPEDHTAFVDGIDLTPMLRGEAEWDGDRTLMWHMPHVWGPRGPGISPFTAIRRGPWKLIFFHAERTLELYNLENDIRELADVSEFRPGLTAELAHEMRERFERLGGQMSIDAATNQPVPLPGPLTESTQPEENP